MMVYPTSGGGGNSFSFVQGPTSTSSTYWTSPTTCPNKDLTHIMFASDFRVSGGIPFEDYMIGLPSDWDTR